MVSVAYTHIRNWHSIGLSEAQSEVLHGRNYFMHTHTHTYIHKNYNTSLLERHRKALLPVQPCCIPRCRLEHFPGLRAENASVQPSSVLRLRNALRLGFMRRQKVFFVLNSVFLLLLFSIHIIPCLIISLELCRMERACGIIEFYFCFSRVTLIDMV